MTYEEIREKAAKAYVMEDIGLTRPQRELWPIGFGPCQVENVYGKIDAVLSALGLSHGGPNWIAPKEEPKTILIVEPTEDDVRRAVAAVTLTWVQDIRYWVDHEGMHRLSVRPSDDIGSAPGGLLSWLKAIEEASAAMRDAHLEG